MIRENLERLFDSVEKVKQRCGINYDIAVVPATKYVGAAEIAELVRCGVQSVGENRVQDFLKKREELIGSIGGDPDKPDWQFIGQLQTNKVKYIVDKVSLIQSVDREVLAEEIDKQCFKMGLVGNILIEVNIADEPTKGGISVDKLFSFAEKVVEFKNINVAGLMCIAPATDTPEKNRKYYLRLKELYDKLDVEIFDKKFRFLSMGMSGDYQTAIECGANMIRPGSVLFGR